MARLKEIKRHVRAGVISLTLKFTNEKIKKPVAFLRTKNSVLADKTERKWRKKWAKDLIESTYGAGGMTDRSAFVVESFDLPALPRCFEAWSV